MANLMNLRATKTRQRIANKIYDEKYQYEWYIVNAYSKYGATLRDVGKAFSISYETVRKIVNKHYPNLIADKRKAKNEWALKLYELGVHKGDVVSLFKTSYATLPYIIGPHSEIRLCIVENCSLPTRSKNLCKLHYQVHMYNNDVQTKLRTLLRSRINMAINHYGKRGSAVKDLGCTVAELKKHIESLWENGMTWDNWEIHGWHIDHIRPLASFDLANRDEFLTAVHYSNLQPLWAKSNLSKGKKKVGVDK